MGRMFWICSLSTDEESAQRIAKEIGVISKADTAVYDTTSQSDGRPTAIAVGAGACIFMGSVLLLLLVLDLATLTSHLKLMKKNISWLFSRRGVDPSLLSTQTETSPSLTDLQQEGKEAEDGVSQEVNEAEDRVSQEGNEVDEESVDVTVSDSAKF